MSTVWSWSISRCSYLKLYLKSQQPLARTLFQLLYLLSAQVKSIHGRGPPFMASFCCWHLMPALIWFVSRIYFSIVMLTPRIKRISFSAPLWIRWFQVLSLSLSSPGKLSWDGPYREPAWSETGLPCEKRNALFILHLLSHLLFECSHDPTITTDKSLGWCRLKDDHTRLGCENRPTTLALVSLQKRWDEERLDQKR